MQSSEKIYSVSGFIRLLNRHLSQIDVHVQGEVTEVSFPASGHVYFTIKDQESNDVLKCMIWKNKYQFLGIDLEKGVEVLIKGKPNYYGPFGKLSLQADTVELVGEGALKRAYDKRKKKLTQEGIFVEDRKRPIADFPNKIGVITSLKGAVIHDFLSNLEKFGFDIKLIHSNVEGAESAKELILSMRAFKEIDVDLLIIMRGGGSMQSLSGFDNEALVREIVAFPVPVIAGIGHHQDVPLAALAADATESTPTAVAMLLNSSWINARHQVREFQHRILSNFDGGITSTKQTIDRLSQQTQKNFTNIFEEYKYIEQSVQNSLYRLRSSLTLIKRELRQYAISSFGKLEKRLDNISSSALPSQWHKTSQQYALQLRRVSELLNQNARLIETNSPQRQLQLGYSLIRKNGTLIRKGSDIAIDDELEVQLSDSRINTTVTSKKTN